MRDVVDEYRGWRAEGVGAGRAVVIKARGSTPRPEGGTLLVADDGRIAGSISGGCVEAAAIAEVTAARRGGYRRVVHYGISDEQGWSVGLSCGGSIDVLVEPDVPAEIEAAASGADGVAVAAWLPVADAAADRAPMVIDAGGRSSGSLGDRVLDRMVADVARPLIAEGISRTLELPAGAVFVEVFDAPQRLVIVGAGQVAVHLVALARELGFHTVIVDPRGAFATRDRFPTADEIILGWPDEVADRAGIDEHAYVVIVSHDPRLDEPAIETALRRGARYVGVIGSRRTQVQRRARLAASGLSPEQLAQLHGPIGLDLGGSTPGEVALAILAEVVATRHARSGGPLTPRVDAPRAVPG
jgi:xanthine dehydrogenase accessory factor